MDLRMDDLSTSTPRLRKIKEEELIPDSDHRLLPKPSAISPMLLFSSRIMSTRSIKPTSSARQAKPHDHANKNVGDSDSISSKTTSKTRRVSKSSASETQSGSLEILTTEATRRISRRISSTSRRSEIVKGNADESIAPLCRSRRMLLSSQSELNTTIPSTSSNLGLNESSLDVSIVPGMYGGKPAEVPKSGSDLSTPVDGNVPSGCSPVDTRKSMLKSKIPITLMPITSSSKKLEGDDLESSRILCRQYSFMSDITMDYSLSTVLQSRKSRSKLTLSSTSVSSLKDSHLVNKATGSTHRPPSSASVTYVMEERSHDRSFRSTNTIARTKKERRKSKSTGRTCKSLPSEEQTSKTKPATDPERNTFSHHGSKIPPELLSVGKKREELSSLKRNTDPVVNTFDALKTAFPPDIIRQHFSVKSDVGHYTKSLSRQRSRSRHKPNRSISGIQPHEIVETSPISSSTTQSLTSHRDPALSSSRSSSREAQKDQNCNISIKSASSRTTSKDDSCSSATQSQSQSRTSRSRRSFAQTDMKKKKKTADPSCGSLQRLARAPSTSSKKPSFQEDEAICSSSKTTRSRSSAESSKSLPRGVEGEDSTMPLRPRGGLDYSKAKIRGTNLREAEDWDVLSTSTALPGKKKKSSKKKKSKSSRSSTIISNGTESRTENTKTRGCLKKDLAYEEASRQPSVNLDIGQYSIDPSRNQSRSRTKSPQSTLNSVLSLRALNLGSNSPSTSRSLPASLRENSARSERTSGSTRSLREPLHYKSPNDEQFKYMMAQLRLDRQKADEERNGLLALKGNLQREGSYKDVQSYMKKYIEGSMSMELSPNAVDLEEASSYPLPWLFPL